MEKNRKIIIYTDGGARGNPGPAAIGVVIHFSDCVKSYEEAIGNATNNVAEYKAVIFGLKKTKALLGGEKAEQAELEIRSDSELIVHQLNGKYKIKEDELKMLFVGVWNAKQEFHSVQFVHIPREKNEDADKLVNRALDRLL